MRVSSADLAPHAIPHDAQIIAPDGQRVVVTKTLRDAPLDRLHARKQIDDCLYAAGDWCRALFENFGTDGVRAMDFSKPVIDSGSSNSMLGVTDAQLRAGKRLKNIANFLGAEGFDLVVQVLARRRFIEQIASERGLTSQRDKDFLARRFRECLDTIATLGGFKVSGAVKRIVGDKHADLARSANRPELHRALVAVKDADRLEQFRQFLTAAKGPVNRPKLALPPGEAA